MTFWADRIIVPFSLNIEIKDLIIVNKEGYKQFSLLKKIREIYIKDRKVIFHIILT